MLSQNGRWSKQVFTKKDYDLTIVSHTEPNDIDIYSRKDYYFNYDNPAFDKVIADLNLTSDEAKRKELYGQAQKILADDAVVGFLYELPKVGVWDAKLQGLWENAPIQANDLTKVKWSGLMACWPRARLRPRTPSALPDISPARGEIGFHASPIATLHGAPRMTADLPPCGGDVRQDRGGATPLRPARHAGNLHHDRLPPQAPRHRARHAGAGLDGGVRRAGGPARRPGAADAGHERQRRPGRAAAQPDGPQRAAGLALSALGRRPAEPRFRPLLHLFGAGHRSRARAAGRLAAAGADRACALDRSSPSRSACFPPAGAAGPATRSPWARRSLASPCPISGSR